MTSVGIHCLEVSSWGTVQSDLVSATPTVENYVRSTYKVD